MQYGDNNLIPNTCSSDAAFGALLREHFRRPSEMAMAFIIQVYELKA